MNMRTIKRIGIGLLTTVAILIVFDVLPDLIPGSLARYRMFEFFYFWSAVEGGFVMFVAAFGGAYVARVHFVVPAVVLAAMVWASVAYFAISIAATAGQGDILAVAGSNILALILGGVGAAAGAYFGRYLATEDERNAASAA